MKHDASAFIIAIVRIFVQKPFFFAKIIGLGLLGAAFLVFLGVTLFRAH